MNVNNINLRNANSFKGALVPPPQPVVASSNINENTQDQSKQSALNEKVNFHTYTPHITPLPGLGLSGAMIVLQEGYTNISNQIAKDTLEVDTELTQMLKGDRSAVLIESLKVSYIKSTVFGVLRLVDQDRHEEAETFIKTQIDRLSNKKHKQALEAIKKIITTLIVWKEQFIKLKKVLSSNMKAAETANSYSLWVSKDMQPVNQGLYNNATKRIEDLLGHLLRDIRKTARGLIGIVKFSNEKNPSSEISAFQLILNLSANCSLRKQMPSDALFQICLGDLRNERKMPVTFTS